MERVDVNPEAVRAFGNGMTGVATDLVTAGGLDLEATAGAMAAALGPIGVEFLAAFVAAQTQHVESYATVSSYLTAAGTRTVSIAASYEHADHSAADILKAAATAMVGEQ